MARKGKLIYSEKSFGTWWQANFFNQRFRMLYESLNPKNAAQFRAMPLTEKKGIIGRLIERGKMI